MIEGKTCNDEVGLINKIIKLQLRRKEKHAAAKEFESLVNMNERLDVNMKSLIGEAITLFKSESTTEMNKAVKEEVHRYLNSCIVFNK